MPLSAQLEKQDAGDIALELKEKKGKPLLQGSSPVCWAQVKSR